MTNLDVQQCYRGLSRLKLFLALSRTPHGLLDMAAPALAALLWLGRFPSFYTVLVGLVTLFAGYTAVYALNDVVGYRSDKAKIASGALFNPPSCNDLDALGIRHPMAQGYISFWEGTAWALAWGLVALLGAYLLNPVCVVIFVAGCVLEIIYCFMWRVSPLRVLISGMVKTAGAIAAVFAVDPKPSYVFLVLLFLFLFFWEIGGQNIPNDWADINEDKRFNAQTIPVYLGPEWSLKLILGSLSLAVVFTLVLFAIYVRDFSLLPVLAAAGAAGYFLLLPAWQLFKNRTRSDSMVLFNKASYYPAALLGLVVITLMV